VANFGVISGWNAMQLEVCLTSRQSFCAFNYKAHYFASLIIT